MTQNERSIRDYLAILWRRRLIIVVCLVVATGAAVAYSATRPTKYEATSQVLLSRQNLANLLNGISDQNVGNDFQRIAQTQAELASSPDVARLALTRAGRPDDSPQELLERASVNVLPNADILQFRVSDPDSRQARRLATAFAESFVTYRRNLDESSLRQARSQLRRRMAQLERSGEASTRFYDTLAGRDQQLESIQALQGSNVTVARRAVSASKTQPSIGGAIPIGLGIGLVLALSFAFLREALDTRIHDDDELVSLLGTPLLGRVPEPSRKMRGRLVMLEEPAALEAEPYRLLRANFDFAMLTTNPKVILVTSAIDAEGKSTTIGNLAVSYARNGATVILADLDLRRPRLGDFFGLSGPGITNVALGHVSLDEALHEVPLLPAGLGAPEDNGLSTHRQGSLSVITAGPQPPDAGEFINSHALTDVVGGLRERADLVFLDAPPVLRVSDGLSLSRRADGLFVVARMNAIRRPMMQELVRLLGTTHTPCLGVVITNTGGPQGELYGYYDAARSVHIREGQPS